MSRAKRPAFFVAGQAPAFACLPRWGECRIAAFMKQQILFATLALVFATSLGQAAKPEIQHVMIEPATEDTPRSDTAAIAPLADGRLMVVYNKFHKTKEAGRDHGLCTIWSKLSADNGLALGIPPECWWTRRGRHERAGPGHHAYPRRRAVLIALRAHKVAPAAPCAYSCPRMKGKLSRNCPPIWKRSKGQLLQGGTSCIMELSGGRFLLPFHGGTGNQWSQKNSAGCYFSDDKGQTWKRSTLIDLPKRGAMEASWWS